MLSFKRHRFPPAIITSSIWLYARFTLSLRDVEEVFAERGLDVSYETVRRWVLKFGSTIAANPGGLARSPVIIGISMRWPCSSEASKHWLWRAVDNEG
jgi:putative transposase